MAELGESIKKTTEKESKFEILFSAGLFFQGIFYFLGALSIEGLMKLIFQGFK